MPTITIRSMTLAALLAALSNAGCSTSTCGHNDDEIPFNSGHVNADRTMYTSRLKEERFVEFPPNTTLDFSIGLRDVPTIINVYLSFSPDADSPVAMSAGNSAIVRGTLSKDMVQIKNDTCSDFYVWLTAATSATSFEPVPTGGASSGGASGTSTEAGSSGEAGAP